MAAKQKPNKFILIPFLILHVIALILTWRDLQDRPAELVRGNKIFWRVASGLNTLGSVGYWLIGRRPID
ncbi:MAG: hypothetical protein JWR36_860 [Glaciihabitans sp.]|nr:hypothetical protein [Glaciihabitans sp.]